MNKKDIMAFISLPDIFSITNGALGFFAIYFILVGDTLIAARIVFLCIFLDSFDGFLARRKNNCADFGKSLDSLSDIISFGIVPSLIFISYQNYNIFAFLAGVIYVICGLLRLSRFNAMRSEDYFGLPITIGAIFIVLNFLAKIPSFPYSVLMIITSILFILDFRLKRPSKNGKSIVIFSILFLFISLLPYHNFIVVARILLIALSSIFLIYLSKGYRS